MQLMLLSTLSAENFRISLLTTELVFPGFCPKNTPFPITTLIIHNLKILLLQITHFQIIIEQTKNIAY